MKTGNKLLISLPLSLLLLLSCGDNTNKGNADSTASATTNTTTPQTGQSGVQDDVSQKDVVKIAIGSPDHTTLVQALQAANLVDALSNAGPFTVFAPTNDAFGKLPAGTVEGLLKPEKLNDLQNILQYHVTVSTYAAENLKDGQVLGMVNGDNATIKIVDGKPQVNGANIVASVKASNGIVHIVDAVMLPPEKK